MYLYTCIVRYSPHMCIIRWVGVERWGAIYLLAYCIPRHMINTQKPLGSRTKPT